MMRKWLTGMLLLAVIAGCGREDERPAAPPAAAGGGGKAPTAPAAAAGKVGIVPPAPVSGSCVTVVVSGRAPDRRIAWFLDGELAQDSGASEFCIPEGSRGKIVKVVLGDPQVGPEAAVTVGNAPPEVLDTQLKLVVDGKRRYLESVPTVKDPDADEVTFTFRWYVNGELNNAESGSRLDIGDIRKGDLIRLEILPNDGTVDGAPYATLESPLPGNPPEIVSRPPTNFRASEFVYPVKAKDSDGDPLAYSLKEPPDGAVIDAKSGVLTWPLGKVAPGEYKLSIVATDPDGQTATQEFSINVTKREEGN